MTIKDYYSLLEVDRSATDDEVKRAFRRLARRYHPDMNSGDTDAESRFKEINEAYDVLGDSEKRRDYDEFGDNWRHADELRRRGGFSFNGAHAGSNSMDPRDLFNLFGNGGFEFGSGTGFHERVPQIVDVTVTLEEAFHGCKRVLTIGGQDGGTRSLEIDVPSGISDGGKVRVRPDGSPPIEMRIKISPHRRFRRANDDLITDIDVPLLDALLGGEVLVQTLDGRVLLKVPENTQNGESIRLSGKGMPNLRSKRRGDLFAKVRVLLPTQLSKEEKELYQRLREVEKA